MNNINKISEKIDSPEVVENDDKAFDAVSQFENYKKSKEVQTEWMEKFQEDPLGFFNEENLEKLHQQSGGRRLALFARACSQLTVTPEMAEKYFAEFPEDLKSLDLLFTILRKSRPEDSWEYYIFSMAAPAIEKISRNFPYNTRKYAPETKSFIPSNQYLEIAERRNFAPQALLEEGNFYEPKYFRKLSEEATDRYFSVLEEASELRLEGDHFLEAEKMFGQEFESLSAAQKAEFLRMALVNNHYVMVAEETYNSCFTREMVEDDKKRAIEARMRSGRDMHNVAHSMLFKTYQASSIYDRQTESFVYGMNSTAQGGGDVEEHADHRIILAILDKMKDAPAESEKNVDLLVDFWNKSRNPIFGQAVAEALNSQDVNLAAAKLLKMLRAETGDKNHLSAILYRLEFGQVGISEKGVKYLEKMYNLGELNNPDYFAQRLTAKGDIGVFDDQRVLQKYFNLGDLADSEKTVTPQIHDFVYETLFRAKAGETEEERIEREKYLREFKENYFGFYDDEFFVATGIRFNNLDFKEQGWFLLCYKKADEEKREKLIAFARKFGERGLVSFLSLEYNDDNGDRILGINEKLDGAAVEKILVRYMRIQANARKLEEAMGSSEFLNTREVSDDIQKKLRENIYDAIMSRSTDILNTAYLLAQTGEAKASFYNNQEIKVTDIEEVVEALDVYEDFLEKMKGFFMAEGRYEFSHADAQEQGELSIHNFFVTDKETGEKSYGAVSLRGQGTNEHLRDFEYDGEARINFLFNNEPIALNINDKSRKEATTFRLDRECLSFDELGKNVISKDNTRDYGRLSLDFGSIFEDSGRRNSVMGRVISVGNFYSAQERKKKPEYYHSRDSFFRDLGRADVFKQVAETVEDFIESKYIKKAGTKRIGRAA